MIIDIRSAGEFEKNHVRGAVNVSFAKLIIKPENYLSKNCEAKIICARGVKSAEVVKILSKKGYKVKNISGGYQSQAYNSCN